MFSFKAHGMLIQSEIYFPELEENDSLQNQEVIIQYGKIDSKSKKVIKKGIFRIATEYKITPESVYLIWNKIEICEIFNGRTIVVNHKTRLEENFLRALILGPALGILLHQKSRIVLHASAVEIDGSAVAFIGHNNMGKSTTTISFYKKGYSFVSDDILSLEFDKKEFPLVFPGFPLIKLWPESIKLIKEDPDNFPKILSESEKRSYFIENMVNDPLPLKKIYILEDNSTVKIKPLKPQDALIELIKNSYSANIFQDIDQSDNLTEYAKIVKKVSINYLLREKSFDNIPDMIKIVEDDLKNMI